LVTEFVAVGFPPCRYQALSVENRYLLRNADSQFPAAIKKHKPHEKACDFKDQLAKVPTKTADLGAKTGHVEN
jgi:hypothetical protein